MRFIDTGIPGLVVIEPVMHRDERGFFLEVYRADKFEELGIPIRFVQDNHSKSAQGTLRGLHFQNPHGQGKLVRAACGEVFDVAVDIRLGSPTFGRYHGIYLSDKNCRMMFIPDGFAHGFCVTSPVADFIYKCTDFYAPECERGIRWDDPELHIAWPLSNPSLSEKDAAYPNLKSIPEFYLPLFKG